MYFLLQLANTLGYKTFSEYALELCMAKKPENVEKFLEDLTVKLKTLLGTELEILLKYKKEEVSMETTTVNILLKVCF